MKEKVLIGVSSCIVFCFVLFSVIVGGGKDSEVIKASEETSVIDQVQDEEVEVEGPLEDTIFVEIKGAVVSPGVYEVKSGIRIFELFNTAGGLKEDANIDYINQTTILQDQTLVIILTNKEIEELIEKQELEEFEQSQVVASSANSNTINGSNICNEEEEVDGLVSINKGTSEQLQLLPGIGEVKANAIISYRESNGEFEDIEELLNVDGIGQGTLDQIKDFITL